MDIFRIFANKMEIFHQRNHLIVTFRLNNKIIREIFVDERIIKSIQLVFHKCLRKEGIACENWNTTYFSTKNFFEGIGHIPLQETLTNKIFKAFPGIISNNSPVSLKNWR